MNYNIYDLSGSHLSNLEILKKDTTVIKGSFVRFKVVKGIVEYLYPAEKYCFLPKENEKQFWSDFKTNNGEFADIPKYIQLFSISDILKITIYPILVK